MERMSLEDYIPYLAAFSVVAYLVLSAGGFAMLADSFTLVLLVIGSLPLFFDMLKKIFHGQPGVDIIALVAIAAAVLLHAYLAGAVILLMLSGGEALERYALQRARKELTLLLNHAPVIAHIKQVGVVRDVPVEQVAIGDVVVVKPGEVVPVDGVVVSGKSSVDESALTGESLPVEVFSSRRVLSGSINQNGIIEIRSVKSSKDSKYQQLLRLVQSAEERKAPMVRLADRFTVLFTAITFTMALLAWFFSHDSSRVLAVLVVATPCPLILATPIAVISAISKAAKRGIIVKSGAALELLGRAKIFVFDKTGTITIGAPAVDSVVGFNFDSTEVLRIAASLDQLSAHVLARSLTQHAEQAAVVLDYPTHFYEFFGDGVSGVLDKPYFFGKLAFLKEKGVKIPRAIESEYHRFEIEGVIPVYLSDAKRLLGAIYFADRPRSESKGIFRSLQRQGLKRLIMLTGDRREVAEKIAASLGLHEIFAEYLPEQKMLKIEELKKSHTGSVVMVGDGVNDAAALAAADVGIAMGGHGASASAEAGDIVITANKLSRVVEAYAISRRMLRVALQGIWFGIGLSVVLMVFAAFGYVEPVYGALLQEAIDVLVIGNALRVLL